MKNFSIFMLTTLIFISVTNCKFQDDKATKPKENQETLSSEQKLLYSRAFEVALWALPVTESFSVRIAMVRDLDGKPNDIVINTKPMDSDIHLIALQSQTPYLQGAIDLRNGPIVVDIPKATTVSHLYGVIVDAWQRPLENIDVGLEGWDKGAGAKYLILPPNYDKSIPDGYKVMRSRTYLQNFLIRSISSEGWDTAVEYAYNMQIYPLSKAESPDKTNFLDMSKTGYRAATAFDSEYFNLVNMLIQEEPTNDYDKNMIGMASYIGIEKGKEFNPDAATKKILDQAVKDVQNHLIKASDGISWIPIEEQPGWRKFNLKATDLAKDYLYVYENGKGGIDYERRAAIDYWAYCMPAVLGSGTMYNVAFVDAEDQPIDASKNYRITMPEDFPARNFWSVFGYDSHTRTFIANGTKGRHLSSNDDLLKNEDGSINIYIGPDAPDGFESNWIETIPGTEIFIGLRTYGPEKSVLEGSYKIPRFELVK